MIQYDTFVFATPPRTASSWFSNAAFAVGLGLGSGGTITAHTTNRHVPPPLGHTGFIVSMVRHPVDWLVSYYNTIHGGVCGIPGVDVFSPLAKQAESVVDFLQLCARNPGMVGGMFESYRANTVMRVEDLPRCAIEFFGSVGVRPEIAATVAKLPPINLSRATYYTIGPSVRRQVVAAEKSYCEAFEYF